MLQKIRFTLCSFICFLGSLVADGDLPSEFYVKQRANGWLTTFDIETKQFKLGSVQRKLFSWTTEYDFYDYNGVLQAKAKMRFLSENVVFDVVDANDVPIGTIEEKLHSFLPHFDIFSPAGERLGSAKMNFWGTKYAITSPLFSESIATLSRPFFRRDNKVDWTINIHKIDAFEQKQIDPRLFVVVMAFQTDREYWKSLSRSLQARGSFAVSGQKSKAKAKAKEKMKKVRRYLAKKHKSLVGISCSPQHFYAVEKLAESELGELNEKTFFKDSMRIAKLLDSNKLSEEEKKALYLMLKERFKS